MPDEISDRDLDSLLGRASGGARASGSEVFARTPLAYDFRRPQRFQKDQLRGIENLHEQFARRFSSSLAGTMRMVVDVDLAYVDQVLYSEFILSLTHPCCAYSFTVTPPECRAILSFSNDLVMAIIDRSFGGKGVSLAEDTRPLTPIETHVVNRVANGLFRDLESVWEPIASIRIADVILETNPDFIQAAAASESLLVVAFETMAARASGLVHLAYPLAAFDPLLARLAARERGPQARSRGKPLSMSPALDRIQIGVTAQLARGNLTLHELATLKPGDVIRMDTASDEPAVVFVGSQPKFLAQAGLDGKRRAVKLLRAVEPEDEDAYR